MKLKLGFTGTRKGMNDSQISLIDNCFDVIFSIFDEIELHHGDCVGADTNMHILFEQHVYNKNKVKDCKIILHEPFPNKWHADLNSKDFKIVEYDVREPKSYLKRDHDIVDECDFLIACPKSGIEQRRSGTWATIRYARKIGRKHIIII